MSKRKWEEPSDRSVSRFPGRQLRDRRNATVWFGRSHEARKTRALVRPLRVAALTVLTQWDLVADVLAFVYV